MAPVSSSPGTKELAIMRCMSCTGQAEVRTASRGDAAGSHHDFAQLRYTEDSTDISVLWVPVGLGTLGFAAGFARMSPHALEPGKSFEGIWRDLLLQHTQL